MKVTFFSNYINHHEIPFCDAMYNLIGDQFCFVQTEPMEQERINLGWGRELDSIPYLKLSYDSEQHYQECIDLGIQSDVVLLGSAPYDFIDQRVKQNKLTFYYAERLFRKGILRAFYPPSTLKILKRFVLPGRKSNFHMLCASGYTAFDVSRIFTFSRKTYRWAHFPEFQEYNIENLIGSKPQDKTNILWAGRFISWKHPEFAIKLAKRLKDDGRKFTLRMIGTGEMESRLKSMVIQNELEDTVTFHGSMPPAKVREYMEIANIFIFTSDFNEGWGAVLNESMNSGCAIVASHAIGSVPFLIKNKENGLIYKNGDFTDFYSCVKLLMENKMYREDLSLNAYKTILSLWNAKVGAERFVKISSQLLDNSNVRLYNEGPCSRASILRNNWFN